MIIGEAWNFTITRVSVNNIPVTQRPMEHDVHLNIYLKSWALKKKKTQGEKKTDWNPIPWHAVLLVSLAVRSSGC